MSFAAIRSGEPIPIFDGTDYPYWKDKMMRNIISIDLNAWNIVENGVVVLDKDNLTEAEKKDLALDTQVWVFITNHMILRSIMWSKIFNLLKESGSISRKLAKENQLRKR